MKDENLGVSLKAHLIACMVDTSKFSESLTFLEIPLKGSTQVDVIDNKAKLEKVKFLSTSYNKRVNSIDQRHKFHLMLLITTDCKSQNPDHPHIIFSKISPPIYIDSRLEARRTKGPSSVQTSDLGSRRKLRAI
jgi:hypothetical protein